MKLVDTLKMDKSAFSVASLGDDSDEKEYWFSRTPYERLIAVEILRQMSYDYDPSTTRFQRVLTITQLTSS